MTDNLFVANEKWGDYWHDRFHYQWALAQTSNECPRWKRWPESTNPPPIEIEDISMGHDWLSDAFFWKTDDGPAGWLDKEERDILDAYDDVYSKRFPWRQLTAKHLHQISKRVIGR